MRFAWADWCMSVYRKFIAITLLLLTFPYSVKAQNTKFASYSISKYKMYDIYQGHKETFYCKATFDNKRNIFLPKGMSVPNQYKNRYLMEWEHIVPAENFGRTFVEWREGKKLCEDKSNRECARSLSAEFNQMEADMYNLYPSIGFINAMRSNFNFSELSREIPNSVQGCDFKVDVSDRKVQPAEYTKGVIARTYFYMADAYPRFKINKSMKKLLPIWDKEHPVDEWECKRAKRIEAIQGNPNKFVKEPCIDRGLW